MSLSSLLNNHINLFLSDNSGKKLLFILEKKVFLANIYYIYLISVLHPELPHSYIVCIFYFQLQFLELCICPFQFQVYVHLFESVLGLIDLIILLYYLSIFPVGI